MSFFGEFLRHPLTVGAIAPSGVALSRLATAVVPATGSPVVVELGPGTGSFTRAIQQRLGGRGRHVALEVVPRFTRRLSARYPAVEVVDADAADLVPVLSERGLGHADVVISGLPWAAFAESRQRDVLSAAVAVLPAHGVFTTFAYEHARWTPPARRLLRAVRERFEEVVISQTVVANLPPAVVYYCRRPLKITTKEKTLWPLAVPSLPVPPRSAPAPC